MMEGFLFWLRVQAEAVPLAWHLITVLGGRMCAEGRPHSKPGIRDRQTAHLSFWPLLIKPPGRKPGAPP